MKYIARYLMAAVALGGLAACSEDLHTDNAEVRLPMDIAATYPMQTRATDAGFADGDVMGVYISDHDGESVEPLSTSRVANMAFTLDEGVDKWNGTAPVYWKSQTEKVDVTGYYPYSNSIDNPEEYRFSVAKRQDTTADGTTLGGYEGSDLLWAKVENVGAGDGGVMLTFRHVMAGLTIELEKGDGFTDEEWAVAQKHTYLKNAVMSCTVNLADGTIKGIGDDRGDIMPTEYNGSFRLVAVPQSYDAGTGMIGIDIDGTSYTLTKEELTVLVSGKMHRYAIRVDRRQDSGDYKFTILSESVTPWIDDADFHDGIVREYLTVSVDEPGTFAATLEKMGKDYRTIQSLKVIGQLSRDDVMFIGDMPILQNLNLKETRIEDDCIPGEAFRESLLSHIVFPDKLKTIESGAFYGTLLTGTLVFPEGLEEIGHYAFTDNSRSYSVVFPSTLKSIGYTAFMCYLGVTSGIKGNLILPENLEYIDDNAFYGCHNLYGNLILPNSLKHIGERAFKGCGFDGDLVIPVSIKEICSEVFSDCNFDGNLVLPEGLEIIGLGAFNNTKFAGSLVLPSSLKEIGSSAFKNTAISEVALPENLTYLGFEAFMNCENLTGNIVFPSSITTVEANCFRNTKITGVTLHKDINCIKEGAFADDVYLTSVNCENPEPPILQATAFGNVPKTNVTVEVPKNAVSEYQKDLQWREFPKLTEYSGFVCRPLKVASLGSGLRKEVVLNADDAWTVTHKPDWVTLSATEGNGKAAISVNFKPMTSEEQRNDSIVFRLADSDITTICQLSQFGYEYAEDELVVLQSHSKGNGIGIYMAGDGWTAEQIASGEYIGLCRQYMEYFFGLPPYDRLRDYFDVYAAVALSQDEGVNTPSTYRDTRFGTIWSIDMLTGTGRLIPDGETVVSYVSELANKTERELWNSVIILIPNTPDYSGITNYYGEWGIPISICPPSNRSYPNDARGTVQHEAGGHGFAKLADESIEKNAFPSQDVIDEINKYKSMGWYANISTSGKMADVGWKDLIFDSRYSNYVDIFEGGYGYTRSVYRSEANSCMNYGIPYYNAISRMEISLRVMEAAGEGFDAERDFYSVDTSDWGSTGLTRSVKSSGLKPIPGHHAPVTITKSDYKNAIKQQKRR